MTFKCSQISWSKFQLLIFLAVQTLCSLHQFSRCDPVADLLPDLVEAGVHGGGTEDEAGHAHQGGDDEALGVETQPGEVEPDLDPEVLLDQPERLVTVPVAQGGPLQVQQL